MFVLLLCYSRHMYHVLIFPCCLHLFFSLWFFLFQQSRYVFPRSYKVDSLPSSLADFCHCLVRSYRVVVCYVCICLASAFPCFTVDQLTPVVSGCVWVCAKLGAWLVCIWTVEDNMTPKVAGEAKNV